VSWVKLDDSFHRNDKQLQMSDAAFRVYVCAMSYCAQIPEPTGHLTTAQARALAAGLGKRPAVIAELVRLNAWEVVEDGYLIHDYEEYLERGSRDRVRAFRARKRAGNVTGNGPETAGDVTVTPLARDGYPVPEPVPVPGTTGLRPYVPPSVLPHPAVASPSDPISGLGAFLDALERATGRPARETAKVRDLYLDRLKDYSPADIVAAARGVPLSPYHQGKNDFGVPLTDAEHVLGTKLFGALVGLGQGEIGMVRPETPEERRAREWEEAGRRRAAGNSELQA
jgi:hypothetical protein